MKKIILVDGNNLLFRSFYATAYQGVIMKNSKGFPTNALYGFINMMNKIIKEEEPNYILVAFDKGKTFRHDKYDSYKAGRIEMPDELKLQFYHWDIYYRVHLIFLMFFQTLLLYPLVQVFLLHHFLHTYHIYNRSYDGVILQPLNYHSIGNLSKGLHQI